MRQDRAARASAARAAAPFALCAALCLSAVPAGADDRDLVREAQKNPYVFILLDVSGSMNQSVPCSQEDFADGKCNLPCPPGLCLPHAIGDDPLSKIHGAKQAIYELMQEVDDLNFGFATFDQDNLRAIRKHWWYRVAAAQPQGFIRLDSGKEFPGAGHQDIFGDSWPCEHLGKDNGRAHEDDSYQFMGCRASDPADLDDHWELERVRRWPKMGGNGKLNRTFFLRDAGTRYRVTYFGVDQTIGLGPLSVRIEVRRCTNAACTSTTLVADRRILFEEAGEMLYWEPGEGVRRQPPACTEPGSRFFGKCVPASVHSFFGSGGVGPDRPRHFTSGQDGAWDGNHTSRDPDPNDGNLKQTTVPDPRGDALSVGDVIPFDWLPGANRQREKIALRMAPNLIGQANPLDPGVTPDFKIATYFEDQPVPNLQLKNRDMKPLIADGGTPTGGAMRSFRTWYNDWKKIASGAGGDSEFACRNVFLLVVTDGLAGDGGLACDEATSLRGQHSIKSYAVGFGFDDTEAPGRQNVLGCVSLNGGTGDTNQNGTREKGEGPGPLLPNNKDELVAALREIFNLIRAETKSFAAAAVPSVQANAQDKVILSSFTPVEQPIWPGHVDAYVKPVPFKTIPVRLPDGSIEDRSVPNREELCTGPSDTGCRQWDGAEELLEQAPNPSQVVDGTFNLGLGETQRRVYYAPGEASGLPEERLDFEFPGTGRQWEDLLAGLGLCAEGDTACAANAAKRSAAREVLRFTHQVKQYPDPEDPSKQLDYLLGDVFHSDPIVVSEPNNFRYFAFDLPRGAACGYRCFFDKHRFRRKVLLVGSNDGQLHAFDAGVFRGGVNAQGQVVGSYDNGSGRELFAYVPTPVLPRLEKAASDAALRGGKGDHSFKVDGTVAIADVFIDPRPADGRGPEWRTVAIGGLREGGRGYYALDVTQPDVLGTGNVPDPRSGALDYVPSCADGGSDCGRLPFPAVLWEFTDDCDGDPCDEDLNGKPDLGGPDPALPAGGKHLGGTWSTPNVGLIRVCDGDTCTGDNEEDRFVAIFGGGLDPTKSGVMGNWLYMVDVETGEAIYKRKLVGAAPSEPAAVDTDLDGYFDTLYVGTTAGFVYKVDLKQAAPLANVPGVGRRIDSERWKPFQVFTTEGRPIYYPPTVLFVAKRGRFALAFGTGDREDLWATSAQTGRFYMILDDGFAPTTAGLPFRAASYRAVGVDDTADPASDFLITGGDDGWFLELAPGERLITKTFALSGVTVFSSFIPQTFFGSAGSTTVCGNGGTSRIFVVNTTNANPIFKSGERYRTVQDFVTSPFTELGQTRNGNGEEVDDGLTQDVREHLAHVQAELQKLFPRNCKFANYTVNIKAVRSDTGVEFIAPVPVCIVEKNWKEF